MDKIDGKHRISSEFRPVYTQLTITHYLYRTVNPSISIAIPSKPQYFLYITTDKIADTSLTLLLSTSSISTNTTTVVNMASATIPAFREEQLDAQGQNIRLSRLYTQLCLCFSTPETDPHSIISDVTHYLDTGLTRLTTHFPWVAGRVVHEDSVFKIKPFNNSPSLSVKDLRSQLPSFRDYRAAGFPFSMLDEKVIASRNTLPERSDEPAPVLLLQATLIRGGVLLVVTGQHNCMDIRGQAQIIHLWAKACRGERYTEDELQGGNLPRWDVIPLSEDDDKSKDKSTFSRNAESTKKTTPDEDSNEKPQSTWAYFIFSALSLASLKAIAVESIESGYVSTDDVLSAVIWQSITRTRLARSDSGTVPSTLDRQVDVRRHLGVPNTYTGNVVHKVSTTMTMQRVCEMPLGHLAVHLRTRLQSTDFACEVRRAATVALANATQLSSHGTTATNRSTLPPTDVRISSWVKEDCYHLDFGGVFGRPEAVRRPSFEAWEGLVYFLPKKEDGEVAVAICLRDGDLQRLRGDERFGVWGEWVG